MKLLVKPIYGWGWTDMDQSLDVPEPFELEVSVLEEGQPFRVASGRVDDSYNHPLRGLWIRLSQRHTAGDGQYNLEASDVEQGGTQPALQGPKAKRIAGYAIVQQV